jgi:hypothetical protein
LAPQIPSVAIPKCPLAASADTDYFLSRNSKSNKHLYDG